MITTGVWHLLAGTARDFGVEIGFDDPLPLTAMTAQEV
jgi:hypothetical protein